ncbi:tetratricopeptide repeat protein [Chroococcus sp. FPU101]|uniref:tetratricopeptide repeat protein n=1 Tax=Chroococcus sp. FPU101 TaxID=1974212 RepID=UPI001A8E6E21|nr:tetratricopeptide repeat protein [Chroococcus sp. FPU101]GFE68805.1 TPR repeat-containing protein [Chroococcus sp. FPU101]
MKRWFLSLLCGLLILSISWSASAAETPFLSFTEEQLQQGEEIAKKALEATNKGDFVQAEAYWTQLTEDFPTNPAVWSNRGNARVSQHKLEEAISDYNQAIQLAPDAADPYLNRGAALEGQGHYTEAIADYNKILEIAPDDAMAYNNRGNAKAGLGEWDDALADYKKAANMAPSFAWANANVAVTLYQLGQKDEALRVMRNIVRKYPMFPDMRAALTATLWEKGLQGEAESNWVATVGMDSRYQDLEWVKTIRRWPPNMISALDKFLNLK